MTINEQWTTKKFFNYAKTLIFFSIGIYYDIVWYKAFDITSLISMAKRKWPVVSVLFKFTAMVYFWIGQ